MDALKRLVESVKQMVLDLKPGQRLMLAVLVASLAVFAAWGVTSATRTDMVRVVGLDVDEATRGRIVERLESANQRYEIRDGEILVPRRDAGRVRLDLASKNVLSGEELWDLIKTDSMIATRWDKEKRYQLALQGSLANMIRSIEGIRNARVLLQPGTHSGFRRGTPAGATVTVELDHGVNGLSDDNVTAIAGAVSRVVTGLTMDHVHILDTSGTPYNVDSVRSTAGPASGMFKLEQQIARAREEQIRKLEPGIVAAVAVKLGSSSSETHERRLEKPVPVEKDYLREEVKEGGQGGPPSIKGASDLPQPAAAPSRDESKTSDSEKLVPGFVDTKKKNPAGEIVKITAAVKWPVLVGEDGELRLSEEGRQERVSLVVKALGPPATEDDVTVNFFPVTAPGPLPPPPFMDRLAAIVTNPAVTTIAPFVLLLIVLFLLYRMINRAASPRAVAASYDALRAAIEAEPAGEGEREVVGAAAGDTDAMQRGIRETVERSPGTGALIINRWLSEK